MTNVDTPTKTELRTRGYFTFTLRTLLVVMLLLGGALTWLGLVAKRGFNRRHALRALRAIGGEVHLAEPTSLVQRCDFVRRLLGDETVLEVHGIALDSSQISDAELSYFRGLTQLQRLSVDSTQVGDTGLANLSGLSQLQGLSLSGTQVSDAGLVHLGRLTNLEYLCLEGTQVSDEGVVHLHELTNLHFLSLQRTQVTDAGLMHLRGLTKLEFLFLDGTHVTVAGVEELRNFLPEAIIVN